MNLISWQFVLLLRYRICLCLKRKNAVCFGYQIGLISVIFLGLGSSGGGGGAAGFAKVLLSTRINFANFVNLYQSKNAQLFLISILCYYSFCPLSDPVKWDPI